MGSSHCFAKLVHSKTTRPINILFLFAKDINKPDDNLVLTRAPVFMLTSPFLSSYNT